MRKQASQELFCRAAPTGFMYLLQKMPPGHQAKRWQTQGSVLERDWFLFPCLSDLAVWDLFPYNGFSQVLQRPALLSPIYRRQRFKKRPIFFQYWISCSEGEMMCRWCFADVALQRLHPQSLPGTMQGGLLSLCVRWSGNGQHFS